MTEIIFDQYKNDTLFIRLTPEMKEKLAKIASKHNTNISKVARTFIEEGIKKLKEN